MKKKKEMKGMTKQTKYAGTQTEKESGDGIRGRITGEKTNTHISLLSRRNRDFEQIAALFLKTADNEKEHAKMWFKELAGIGDTAENLAATCGR